MAFTPLRSYDNTTAGPISASNALSVTYNAHENVLVLVAAGVSPSSVTLSDGTNTYVQVGSYANVVPDTGHALFYLKDAAAGTFNLVASTGASASLGIAVWAVACSGLDNTAAAQTSSTTGVGANGATSSPSVTPTGQPAWLIAFVAPESTPQVLTAGAGFTANPLAAPSSSEWAYHIPLLEYERLTSTAGVTADFSSASFQWADAMVGVFTEASAGATGANQSLSTLGVG